MSGMLHPVGPEPARTYWIRRGVLAAVAVLLALGVVVAVANLTKAAVATAPPPAVLPADSPSPSTGSGGATSTASPGGSPSPVLPGATPAASTSAQPSPSVTGTASASAPASTDPTPGARASTSPRPSAKPTTTTVGTPDCTPAELRVTIKGDRSLGPGQKNRFTLSLTNGGDQTCLTSVTDQNFELKVYSGKDRIWSSRDCSKTLADFDRKLPVRADVDWTMTWNGERSVKGAKCEYGSDTPRAGTYWATAQLKGADPVQLRMIVG